MFMPLNLSLKLNKSIRILAVAALAITGVSLGVVPSITNQGASFSSSAYADSYTNAQLRSYARAVLGMEARRQQAYREIKEIIGSGQPIPNIACNQSLRKLSREVREIAENYCDSSKQIVINSGLEISLFNAITNSAQADPQLKKRIQSEMLRLQQQ